MKRNADMPSDFSNVPCLFALFVSKNSWGYLQFSLTRKCSLHLTKIGIHYTRKKRLCLYVAVSSITDRGGHQVVQFSHFLVKEDVDSGGGLHMTALLPSQQITHRLLAHLQLSHCPQLSPVTRPIEVFRTLVDP